MRVGWVFIYVWEVTTLSVLEYSKIHPLREFVESELHLYIFECFISVVVIIPERVGSEVLLKDPVKVLVLVQLGQRHLKNIN